MKMTIVSDDNIIVVDGTPATTNFNIDANIWAIHWDDLLGLGSIEYRDSTPNLEIDEFPEFEYFLDVHTAALVEEQVKIEVEAFAAASTPEAIRNAAWLAQTYEVRAGVIITVRPMQVGKYDDPVLRGLLLNIQSGMSTEEEVTDINGVKHLLNEAEIQAALLDGVRQTTENYNIYYAAINA